MRTLIVSSAVAAVLFAAPSLALAQTAGNSAFCLKKGNSQTTQCAYQTMAQCEKAKESQSDVCGPRSQTTGQGPGTGMSPGSSAK